MTPTETESEERAVIVAGVGAVTPAGVDWLSTWDGVRDGRSGIGPITLFDAQALGIHAAGEVKRNGGFGREILGIEPATWRETLALQALSEAFSSAALSPEDKGLTGIFTGCEKDATDDLALLRQHHTGQHEGRDRLEAAHLADLDRRHADRIARTIAGLVPAPAILLNYSMACAASAVALVQAVRWIRRGRIHRAIVVGVDTPINSRNGHGFQLLGALSENADPRQACRPFDSRRDGFVLAEGAGAMILESARLSRERDGPRLGTILGVGLTNNRSHITKTPVSGEQAARAMEMALKDAGLPPEAVGYINAHATSTDVGDIGEVNAVLAVFTPPPPVSATKSTTGHLVAAAGIVEAAITLASLSSKFIPPTLNLEDQDPECSLDCVANVGRETHLDHALTNSFGFGGSNVSLLIGR